MRASAAHVGVRSSRKPSRPDAAGGERAGGFRRAVRRWSVRLAVLSALLVFYGAVAKVALATAPLNQGLPYVSGSFAQGQLLSAAPGDWLGSQPLSLSYQWQSCAPYRTVVMNDSPAAFWRLGEAQGATSAADEASSPDNGTYTSLPTLGLDGPLSGDPNRAVRLDGAGAFVDVPDASKLKPASAFSVEAWVKTTASSGVIVAKPNAAGSTVSYMLSVVGGKARVTANLASAYTATSAASVNDGNWHHVVGTFSSSTLKVYLDGTAATTSTSGSLAYSTQKLQIGRQDATAGGYLAGVVDEVAVYSTALSSGQVSAHYAAGTTANGVDSSCSNISGATSSSYTPVSGDLGKRTRVKVTGTNADGSASASSYATVVTPQAPANLDPPDLAGTAQDGRVLTAGTGTWSGAATISYGYQWQRCNAYPLAISTDVPEGYWRLGELQGTVAADNGGQNGGTYAPSTGPPGLGAPGALSLDADTAAVFAGGAQAVDLGQSVQFESDPFSVEGWFKTAMSSGDMVIWASGHSASASNKLWVEISSGKAKAIASNGSSTVTLTSSGTYADGGWHQIAFVRVGASSFKLYVDGAQVATSASSTGDVDGANALAYIGNSDGGSLGFVGSLDEIAMYKSALSATQVSNHYSARTDGCSNISGATSSTYTLTSGDANASVAVKVTATNSAGSASAVSKPVAVIAKTAPLNTSPPTVTGSPVVGQTLTAGAGAWDQSASYTYQWRRCAPYSAAVGSVTPLGYWRLGEIGGETPATTAADSSSSAANPGVYVNGPVLGAAGALAHDTNTAAVFDGTSQRVALSQAVEFDTGAFTVEGWFKTTDSSASDTQEIWFSGADTHNYSVQLYVSGGQVTAKAVGSSASKTLNSAASTYADGAWHYVAFTRSGSTFSLYVDAATAVTGTASVGDVDDPYGPAYIGAGAGGTTSFFRGTLDEIAVYTTALNSTQVGAHRAAGLDPCTDIAGATSSTYTLVSGDSGKNVIVHVTATHAGLSGVADSLDLAVGATGSPVSTAAPGLGAAAVIGQALSAGNGSWNPAATSYSYQWHRCDGFQQVMLADIPAGFWPLDELDTAHGVADASGGGSTGSFSGTPKLGRAGPNGYEPATAVSFDGAAATAQNVALPSVQFDSGNFSVEAWFRAANDKGEVADTSGTNFIWSSGKNSTTGRHVDIWIAGGLAQAEASDGTHSILLKSFNAVNDGNWHQVVFTRSSSTVFNLYVDGALVQSGTAASIGDVDTAGTAAYIGNDYRGTAGPFTGAIADVAVYKGTSGALSVSRVQAHMADNKQDCVGVGTNSASYTPVSADRGHRLYVTVTATNAIGSTSADSAETDSVYTAAPAADSPLEGSSILNADPTLKVTALAGSNDYDFQVSASKDFATVTDNSAWQTTGTVSYIATHGDRDDGSFKDSGTYYWRARARDSSTLAAGRWSTPQKVTFRLKKYGLQDYWPIWKAGPLAVNEATGNLILSVPGPSYPTDAGSMGLTLTYNSLDSTDNGLGPGWTIAAGNDGSSLPAKLIDHSNANVEDHYDAVEVVYTDGSSAFYNHIGKSNVYKSSPGDISALRRATNGSSWSLNSSDGSVYTFGAEDGSTGIAELSTADLAAADPGKGELTYAFESLTSTTKVIHTLTDDMGRELTFNWSALHPTLCTGSGVALCVTGPDGTTWKYATNSYGRLKSVDDGTRTLELLSYALDGSGHETGTLIKVQNANDLDAAHASPGYDSGHFVAIGYDSQSRANQIDEGPITGQTPSHSTWTFAYTPGAVTTAAPAHDHSDATHGVARTAEGYTEITPPRQYGASTPKKTTVYYDNLEHAIETVDLLGHTTLAGYDQDNHLLWAEDADGNPTDYSYDAVTKLLTSKTDPDPDGAGSETAPVTSYRYDETAIGTNSTSGPVLNGLQASYYRSSDYSGQVAARQTDPSVDFDWRTSGPVPLAGQRDSFSVRWDGLIDIASEGDYTFSLISDGGSYLTVDDQQPLNDTGRHDVTTTSALPIHLTVGQHRISVGFADPPDTPAGTPPLVDSPRVQLRYSCLGCATPISDQPIPSAVLEPNWGNQTSVIKPRGNLASPPNPYTDLSFSHYLDPAKALPDYTEQKLADGTPLFTYLTYDGYGRTTMKTSPQGNTGLTVDALGNVTGIFDPAYATRYTYYGPTDTAANPTFCGGGSAVEQAGQLESQQPPATLATTYVYDAAGRAIAKTNEQGTTCSTYTAEGRLDSTKDANGHATSYTYDPSGAVRTVTAADSSVTTTVYDESGAVIAKTDGNSHTTTYAHNAEGNQTSVTDPLSHTTSTAYDELGRKTDVTDPLSHVTHYAYDNEGRLTSTVVDYGSGHLNLTTDTAYDTLGRAITKTDARGHDTTYTYNADGDQTSVTDPLSHTTTSVYDELGRLASTTDANSHDTTYGYDLDGNQTTATAPDTGVTTTGYDPAGRKLTITDPLSHTTTNLYDTAGQLVKTTTPTGEVTSNGYDAVGNKVQVTDPSGHTTSYTYDPVNRQVTEKTPLGDTTTTAYDNVGNKTSVTDPLGHVTTYAYDAADRLTSTVVDPGSGHLNITSSTAYDAAGRVSSKTDPNSHTTSYGYDDADRQTSVTGPDGSNTALTYDANGNLLTRTDDNSHTTSYTYDDADQQTSKTDPLGHQWTYTYDPAGNKTEMVDGNGNATTGISTDGITGYSYDSVNRLTGIDYSDSTPDVAYAYDLAGNRTTMTDGAGTVAYTYDDSDRLTGVIRGTSGFAYTYDTAGRLSSRTYPDGTATSYSYDNDSRLATATNSSNTTGYTYDNASRLTATTYPNGWSEHRTYDAADRLSDIRSVKSGSTDLAVATYTRDAAGNPTTIVRDGVSEAYGYDSADRVTGACYGGALSTCASGSKITYAYDKVGNRSSQTKFGTTTTYTYDGGDELTGSTVGSTTTLYSFDDDGQQTGEGYKTYSYDLAGRLVQATDHSSVVATFTYDGSGNRLTKTASSVTTNYAWDENNDLPMLALEWQGSTVLRDYLYGDRLISMNSGGAAYYLHHDALNTTSAVTKSTAAIEWTYTYDPYGNTRTTTKVDPAAPTNPIQYTGELLDTETSLYDLRARIYNPTAGGFLSTDPVPQDPGGSGISAFLYANAAPLVLTDPAGQRPVSDDGPDGHPCFTSGWWFDSPSECPSPQTGTHGGDSDGSNSGSAAGANDDSHPSRTQTNAYDSRFTNGVLPGDRWGQDLVRQQLDPNEQRIQYAYEFFMSKGFTPEQAAALVGSLMVESYAWTESDAATNGAMRPDQLQRNSDGSVCYTDKGEYCGRGLASWSPDRWDDFERWAADANENGYGEKLAVNSFVAQLEFVSWELKNNRPLTYDYLKRQTTVLGAVKAIQCGLCKNNPNPAIEATGYLNAGIPHLDWRYCNARRVLHNFGPGTSLYGCPQHGQSGD